MVKRKWIRMKVQENWRVCRTSAIQSAAVPTWSSAPARGLDPTRSTSTGSRRMHNGEEGCGGGRMKEGEGGGEKTMRTKSRMSRREIVLGGGGR